LAGVMGWPLVHWFWQDLPGMSEGGDQLQGEKDLSGPLRPEPSPLPYVRVFATLPNAHPAGCVLVEFSRTARLVAAADGSGTVLLFANSPARLLHAFPHDQPIEGLCLSRSGQMLAVLCVDDPRVYLYETCAPFRSVETTSRSNQCTRLVQSPNENEIWLVQFNEVTLQLRDVITGEVRQRFQDGSWASAQLVVAGSQRAVGGYDGNRGRWRISLDKPVAPGPMNVGPICNLDVTRDGMRLAWGEYGQDGRIQLADGKKISSLPLPTDCPVAYRRVAFSDDGLRLVTVCWRTADTDAPSKTKFGHILAWDIKDPSKPIATWEIAEPVDAVAITPPYVCLTTGDAWQLLEFVEVSAAGQ